MGVGPFVIIEEDKVIRIICDLFLQGNCYHNIKKYIKNNGVKMVTRREQWNG